MAQPLVWIHIIAGILAIVLGACAFLVTKGSPLHRRAGAGFALSMIVMGSLGSFGSVANDPPLNVINGLLVCYLVTTGWLAAKPQSPSLYVAATSLLVSASLMFGDFYFASSAVGSVGGLTGNGDLPPEPYYVFGFLCGLCAVGDLRVVSRILMRPLTHEVLHHKYRLRRHIWRMGFALFVATGSFFLGQPGVFPEWLQTGTGTYIRAIPVLLVIAATVYWFLVYCRRKHHSRPVRGFAST